MKKLETKDFKFTLDSFDDEKGTFTGYASVFGVKDAYGDIVDKGAFKRSLKDKKEFPILWSHNIMEPIGVGTLAEDEKGLRVTSGQLNLDVQRGKEVRSLMKQKAIEGLSIGYQTIDAKPDRDDPTARHLRECKLWEFSPCVFGANDDALVDEVKSAIAYHDYGTADEGEAWDGKAEVAEASVEDLKKICAWYDAENEDTKGAYKLPHHHVDGLKAVWKGVAAAMAALLGARGGADIPSADRKAVYNHLAKHYAEFEKDAPEFKTLDEIHKSQEDLQALFDSTEPPVGTPGEEPPDTLSNPAARQLLAKLAEEAEHLHKSLGGNPS